MQRTPRSILSGQHILLARDPFKILCLSPTSFQLTTNRNCLPPPYSDPFTSHWFLSDLFYLQRACCIQHACWCVFHHASRHNRLHPPQPPTGLFIYEQTFFVFTNNVLFSVPSAHVRGRKPLYLPHFNVKCIFDLSGVYLVCHLHVQCDSSHFNLYKIVFRQSVCFAEMNLFLVKVTVIS